MRSGRLASLRQRMVDEGISAMLVTDPVNIRWLSGFSGSAGRLYIPAEGDPLLITDARYTERAEEEAPGWTLIDDRTWGWLGEHHPAGTEVGIEADHMTWATVREIEDLEAADLRPTTGLVAGLRQIKDDGEIMLLRRACALTTEAFEGALGWLRPGLTEIEVARRLVADLIAAGADGPAFPPIVAAGPNGSRPHHDPGTRPLAAGDLVTLDFGALVKGYHADMTRTVAIGAVGLVEQRLQDLVRVAQQAGVEAAVPGASVTDVDAACRTRITDAGHGDHFTHGTGHGVGMGLHETPFLTKTGTGTLVGRMTVTIEPGVYLPGLAGVRIEDVVLVTDDGPERLTTAPRDLITL